MNRFVIFLMLALWCLGFSVLDALAAEPAGEGQNCGGTPPILCKEGLQCSGPSGTCTKAATKTLKELEGEGYICKTMMDVTTCTNTWRCVLSMPCRQVEE